MIISELFYLLMILWECGAYQWVCMFIQFSSQKIKLYTSTSKQISYNSGCICSHYCPNGMQTKCMKNARLKMAYTQMFWYWLLIRNWSPKSDSTHQYNMNYLSFLVVLEFVLYHPPSWLKTIGLFCIKNYVKNKPPSATLFFFILKQPIGIHTDWSRYLVLYQQIYLKKNQDIFFPPIRYSASVLLYNLCSCAPSLSLIISLCEMRFSLNLHFQIYSLLRVGATPWRREVLTETNWGMGSHEVTMQINSLSEIFTLNFSNMAFTFAKQSMWYTVYTTYFHCYTLSFTWCVILLVLLLLYYY